MATQNTLKLLAGTVLYKKKDANPDIPDDIITLARDTTITYTKYGISETLSNASIGNNTSRKARKVSITAFNPTKLINVLTNDIPVGDYYILESVLTSAGLRLISITRSSSSLAASGSSPAASGSSPAASGSNTTFTVITSNGTTTTISCKKTGGRRKRKTRGKRRSRFSRKK